jgi:deazaflavin-dependent oxidoreductase (nitroreductase family)
MTIAAQSHYRRPGIFTRHVFNPAVRSLTRMGLSVWGSRVLEVRGRKSGALRRTPVNLLFYGGSEFLVSPRGQGEWVRNLRSASGRLDLLLGRRRQTRIAHEVPDTEKVEILRAYLTRWKAEAGIFFEGVGPDSSDEQIAAIAPNHPVFRLEPIQS